MAAKRNSFGSGMFSPTSMTPPSARRHHSARRRSFTLANGTTSSGSSSANGSNAPWSNREHALLVRAWRDVAEHPASAVESVDAFQTRLFLRFQELTGVGCDNDNDNDDTVSMAGSECSMESIDSVATAIDSSAGANSLFARTRTQTSVVRKTYALRHMARFISAFGARQDALRQQQQQQQQQLPDSADSAMDLDDSQTSQDADTDNTPVDWFALSKSDQIERFQAAGATSYIELDEHSYATILTTLELQDKCKLDKPTTGVATPNTAAPSQPAVPWSDDEVRCVLAAWRATHLRTPTKVPGADTLYARFVALSGAKSSQRSKPEVADVKIALLHMHNVISAFEHAPQLSQLSTGKATRGRSQRIQRPSWFALSTDARRAAFAASSNNRHDGCSFVDLAEDMYKTISELTHSTSPRAGGSGDTTMLLTGSERTPELRKRRSLTGGSSSATRYPSFSSSVSSSSSSSSSNGSTASDTQQTQQQQQSLPTMIDLVSDDDDDDNNATRKTDDTACRSRTSSHDTSSNTTVTTTHDNNDVDMDHEQHEPDVSVETDAQMASAAAATSPLSSSLVDVDAIASSLSPVSTSRLIALKKQKLAHSTSTAPSDAATTLFAQQAQDLSALVLQVQEERASERREREKLLSAIKVDQQSRETVLELLRLEQEERRRDRAERRTMMQMLLAEKQLRVQCDAGSTDCRDDTKMGVKDEP